MQKSLTGMGLDIAKVAHFCGFAETITTTARFVGAATAIVVSPLRSMSCSSPPVITATVRLDCAG
jgi:hypothetical protein